MSDSEESSVGEMSSISVSSAIQSSAKPCAKGYIDTDPTGDFDDEEDRQRRQKQLEATACWLIDCGEPLNATERPSFRNAILAFNSSPNFFDRDDILKAVDNWKRFQLSRPNWSCEVNTLQSQYVTR